MTGMRHRLSRAVWEIRRVLASRSLWVCLLSLSLAATIYYVSDQTKAVYIRDGEATTLRYTLKQEPNKILHESGIATMAYDMVDFSGFEGKMGVISIKRAFPVTIRVDGILRTLMATEMTVADLLAQEGIRLGEYDMINISPVLYLSPGDKIVIRRVEVRTTTVDEEIPFATEYKENALLPIGATRVLSPGQPGKRVLTYAERIVDGVLQRQELADTQVIRQPVTQLVLRGARNPVSDLDFGVELDANGVPVSYKKLLPNQICTGYNAGKGAYGASHMNLYDGSVAVRANEIPYGTKLYITSADNRFVYGFAIAADTGIGLMAGAIDIDLYYETYLESCLNGRKYLNVYILE
ncbi:MAG: G5 domain-containing protein [Oscillospiraceae bacterium]